MHRFLGWLKNVGSREDGQGMILFASGAVAAMALTGLVVDAGRMVGTRAEVQKAADAAALAAVQELPNATAAISVAQEYVERNASGTSNNQVTVLSDRTPNDVVVVVARKRVDYTFLRVLGLSGQTISAKAITKRGYLSGAMNVVPWGFILSNDPTSTLLQNNCYKETVDGIPTFKTNTPCVLKFGAGTNSGGDFGSLALDGTGGAEYRAAIKNGADKLIQVEDQVEVQTGNMQGPTKQGLSDRLGATGNCVAKSDVLIHNADGTASVKPGCENSPRLIVVPLVDKIKNPEKSTVKGFALLYLLGESQSGGATQVHAEFVELVGPLPKGVYNSSKAVGSSETRLIASCSVCP